MFKALQLTLNSQQHLFSVQCLDLKMALWLVMSQWASQTQIRKRHTAQALHEDEEKTPHESENNQEGTRGETLER